MRDGPSEVELERGGTAVSSHVRKEELLDAAEADGLDEAPDSARRALVRHYERGLGDAVHEGVESKRHLEYGFRVCALRIRAEVKVGVE